MKDRESLLGKGSYFLRMHHHPNNPYLFPVFNVLPKTVLNRLEERFDVR